ncbi:MAG TPA: toll/interleukin-1 receptor domain-containing protein [Bryobacteraceae bacterium]|nr:toll/interleukin-1 receptor domain-containing protein [Bryobacteraceae bacterium]
MQAPIRTLFPCYAPAERPMAAALADFLEKGADVRVFLDEGEMRPGEDLASKARDARMADIVLVFFSRASLPPRWPRAQWEDALVKEPEDEGVRIAFLRCDDCTPPAVLKPRFELAGLPLRAMREAKRWVRRSKASYFPPSMPARVAPNDADLEVLGIALADRPGVETAASFELAFEFARAFREDFDEILMLECGDRSLAALAGDLGAQLGLRLEGDLYDSLERLRGFCSARRFLVLLADARTTPEEFIFGGRCSTLIVHGGGLAPSEDPLRAVQRAFRSGDAPPDWAELCEQARLGRRLTRDQGRIAECFELMESWHEMAYAHRDRKVLDESAREMVWILEGWGREREARVLDRRRRAESSDQMELPF